MKEPQVIAIAGLAKNVGKTSCLNALLAHFKKTNPELRLGVTSIGTDGEELDSLQAHKKPKIFLEPNTCFATTESYWRHYRACAEILALREGKTSLGRLVIARNRQKAPHILSGPVDNLELKKLIVDFKNFACQKILIDGALSRLSFASPFCSDAFILSVGLALNINPSFVIQSTLFLLKKVYLNPVCFDPINTVQILNELPLGLYFFNEERLQKCSKDELNEIIYSSQNLEDAPLDLDCLFVKDALSDDLMLKIMNLDYIQKKGLSKFTIIVRDFTHIFLSFQQFQNLCRQSMALRVLKSTKLLTISINPSYPGLSIHSSTLAQDLRQELIRNKFSVSCFDPALEDVPL